MSLLDKIRVGVIASIITTITFIGALFLLYILMAVSIILDGGTLSEAVTTPTETVISLWNLRSAAKELGKMVFMLGVVIAILAFFKSLIIMILSFPSKVLVELERFFRKIL